MPGCLLDIYVTVAHVLPARWRWGTFTGYPEHSLFYWSQPWLATSAAVRHLVTNRWTSAGGAGILVPISH